jgi:hypothetical protein
LTTTKKVSRLASCFHPQFQSIVLHLGVAATPVDSGSNQQLFGLIHAVCCGIYVDFSTQARADQLKVGFHAQGTKLVTRPLKRGLCQSTYLLLDKSNLEVLFGSEDLQRGWLRPGQAEGQLSILND